ncbi:hypothetical protein [Pseudoclavibacter terrae]|uniref:hypothetical protein n=1 Tax=Pseudoclavibacter terrae TaxID=1530195 RepID=UPI00232D07F1|nr:hypothetical protein [Pseudoclavibacter terrae]
MLTIGEFAQTTGISVKALRHYDETKAFVPFGGAVPTDEDANRGFVELHRRIVEAGLEPGPGSWTTFREAPGSTARASDLQMLLCWPIARIPEPGDASWGDERTLVGELPPRTELVAVWRSDGADLPEGSVHPAVVALFDALAERGMALTSPEVRQSVVGEDASDFVVEVSVTLP